eukprot:scaffold1295_cov220-Pinguiococcus_pyrenoidosus.AAC.12
MDFQPGRGLWHARSVGNLKSCWPAAGKFTGQLTYQAKRLGGFVHGLHVSLRLLDSGPVFPAAAAAGGPAYAPIDGVEPSWPICLGVSDAQCD